MAAKASGGVRVVTLAHHPELRDAHGRVEAGWPRFMTEDPMSWNLSSLTVARPECQPTWWRRCGPP